ncbi:MAG: imidazolonepropionase [Saprospiraceae bacterium]|nr:imidazolonepropionase [Saprospiraceae bacterium]
MAGLSTHGAIEDAQLELLSNAGVVVDKEMITDVGPYDTVRKKWKDAELEEIEDHLVLIPGLIDAHTHSCYAGSRANDFARRIAGMTYQEIAQAGGGIWQTVQATRKASVNELNQLTEDRIRQKLASGITTLEIKSGYGLSLESEIKILECIKAVAATSTIDIVSTCLAAHLLPGDFKGNKNQYLSFIRNELLPVIKEKRLSNRVDIFIEREAFHPVEAGKFLRQAKSMDFDLVVHADQFSVGGSEVAAACKALSADHLEVSTRREIQCLIKANVICTALPGASIGLGCSFAPARMILDEGGCLVIASDHNPGSAPHGDLLTLAAIIATYEKLRTAEVFAAMTFRAALALNMTDRGRIIPGFKADFIGFKTKDFRDILYNQGNLRPYYVWKNGVKVLPDGNLK